MLSVEADERESQRLGVAIFYFGAHANIGLVGKGNGRHVAAEKRSRVEIVKTPFGWGVRW